MFVKRNRRQADDAKCTSILLVHGERVPAEKRPRGRPPKDAPPRRTRVVHRVLANLTKLPPDLVDLIEAYCRDEARPGASRDEACIGPCYGQLAALLAIAETLGIPSILGSSRRARLALFLVLARVAHRGSRLSAVRWARDQAVKEAMGLSRFDEDDLYEALDWLEGEQERIEVELAKSQRPAALFLYDVTSSYLEGQHNELAAPGYNRDGKKYKKQVVVGLLTDETGDPKAIRVYRGNTADPRTVGDPIRFVSEKLGVEHVVFVGDRGMLKSRPRAMLAEAGFRYLTALTDAQVRALLRKGVLQMGLFDEEVAEVQDAPERRLLLRLNPDTRARERQRRADQLDRVSRKVEERNAFVLERPRASPQSSLKQARAHLETYRLDRFVEARLEGRRVVLEVDETRREDIELLDGCYVLETDVPGEVLDARTANARYMGLAQVERDFRRMKTGMLEIRPIFLRKAGRTRAHAFVTMLAVKILRALEARVQDLGLTAQDALDRLAGVRLLTFADPSLALWRLPTKYAAPQREVLDQLPSLPAPMLSRSSQTRKRA
jgi:hypothetical protein